MKHKVYGLITILIGGYLLSLVPWDSVHLWLHWHDFFDMGTHEAGWQASHVGDYMLAFGVLTWVILIGIILWRTAIPALGRWTERVLG